MEINLLRAVKFRVFDELRYTVQAHQVYRDKVQVYHKFPYKERPMMGVVLRNASSTRTKLSADDYNSALKSHLALAKAEGREDKFLEWAWEDPTNMTEYVVDEDMSSQIEGSTTFGLNRVFYTAHKPIISGKNNTIFADNFRQIVLTLNGERTFAEYVNGEEGLIMLPVAPVAGSTLTVSYWRNKLTPPGRYYIEVVSPMHFVIDPLYSVEGEKVIDRTTGTETTASLDNDNLLSGFEYLYTWKNKQGHKFRLDEGTDYTIDNASGVITFLNPLEPDTTLYANYRWIGATLGPFEVPQRYHYVNNALPGVTLAFGNQLNPGGRMVLIVYPKREPAASVYGGHFNMSFDIEVFTRDPQQLADLTDHIINDLWNNKRNRLIEEGLTIEEMDPTGETEDVYDNNTGDLYYKNSINLQILSEWKKFVPYLYEIQDFDYTLYRVVKTHDYAVSHQNKIFEIRLVPHSEPFVVKYPKDGRPRYF